MTVHTLDPLEDPRWHEFVLREPRATAFHSVPWLRTLRRTYGYDPVVFTTCAPGAVLEDGIVFCRVESWFTGKRLVSLPFSDHCEPFVNGRPELNEVVMSDPGKYGDDDCKYIEVRPKSQPVSSPFERYASYWLHEIDLTPGCSRAFGNFHRDCIQRKIRRAEREQLRFAVGTSRELLNAFYGLHTRARRRLGLVPQPIAWFENLLDEFGQTACVRVAFHSKDPIAAILTLSFRNATYYKYGCSDERFNALGGGVALMWHAIQHACEQGHTTFDMGRSDIDQPGLIAYKDRWGARRTMVNYYRWPLLATSLARAWAAQIAKHVFSSMPPHVAQLSGRMLYRHIG